ncbi:hypothetical protein D3C76_1292580 [compost metagenome]
MLRPSPAFVALISGLTIRLGVTRRSLIATSVIMLIRTPDAKAEIHSITGKKLKNTLNTMITTTAISKIGINDASPIPVPNLRYFFL